MQQPWAWAGLLALGLPVLIHLLGRVRARLLPFPTLRFVVSSRIVGLIGVSRAEGTGSGRSARLEAEAVAPAGEAAGGGGGEVGRAE